MATQQPVCAVLRVQGELDSAALRAVRSSLQMLFPGRLAWGADSVTLPPLPPRALQRAVRLLSEAHRRLLDGVRGSGKQPGELRTSQNWIGGSRPGIAVFVPPPADQVPALLADLERFIHAPQTELPALVRVALVHAQFETIHPFLDGNGRIGRLLITALFEYWGVLSEPTAA